MRELRPLFVLYALVAILGCTPSGRGISTDERTFLTGSEQAIIESFVQKRDTSPTTQPAHSLDRALAALLARAYPPPDRLGLISGAIAALCDDYRDQTHRDISMAQRDAWLHRVVGTNSFAPVLQELEQPRPENLDRRHLMRAGLRGMLHATGWDAACVLTDAQGTEMKKMEEARESPSQERGVLGLNLNRWPAVEVIAGTPAADAGLRSGDALLQIAGRSVAQTGAAKDVINLLAGPPGESIQLTMGRNGQQFTAQVQRVSLAAMRVKADLVAPSVVCITIPLFEGSDIADRVKRIIQDRVVVGQARAVILDLRGNPGGRPEEANAVADIFLDSKCLQVVQFRSGQCISFRSHPGSLKVRVIVLTDGNTGSAAEMLAMALRDNGRAVIVGQTTAGALFGKDGEDVGDNQVILFRSEPTVLSPTGRDYSITGIPPDVPVAGPKEHGKDEVLRLAVELAGRGINAAAPLGQ